ncbi:sensor histidine kinase [Parablautia muri]|nr:HAMP domain-containing sensor histidine kinase [Parablautia muri]
MKSQTVIWILAICLMICLATLIVGVVYFLWQWKKLDRILALFQQGKLYGENGALDGLEDALETRESRVISQLWRILADARFKAGQAVGEKDRVMELISDLSHQLRTPLSNIVMNTELLQDPLIGGDEDKRREFLAHTKSQADKMQWLMADLLKTSKLENGMIRFEAGNHGVKGTIARALGSVYAQAAGKNMQLIVEEFQDFDLYHNPKWTAEAMANILENAVKYSPDGSSIRITLTKLDIYTKIMIADEGIGISEKEYNLIFKRFYRGREVEQQEGSGLGLYLAQLILQQEKGYITVASKKGCGSRFSLFLLNKG